MSKHLKLHLSMKNCTALDGESKRILELPAIVAVAFFPSNGAMLVLSVGLILFAEPLRLAACESKNNTKNM